MRLAWAFFKRDATIALSYRASFVVQVLGNLLILGVFYYIGKLVGTHQIPALAAYGGNFLAFLLVGFALTDFASVSLTTFATQIREGQTTGTLEATLMSPVRLPVILIYSSLWSYFFSVIRLVMYLGLGGILYGVSLGQANLFSALAILLLTVLCFMGIGITWAGVIMLVKRGESILTVVGSLVVLLSGVLFPIELLPGWAQKLASLVPLTHALNAMRLALLKGATLSDLAPTILVLSGFAVVLLTGGMAAFQLAVRFAKHTGSLSQY